MIEPFTCCQKADCPKKDVCSRYAFYLKAIEESESYNILNANKLQVTEDGCRYLITPSQKRVAYGFKHLYATIPNGNARKVGWGRLFSSDSAYYRVKRGDYPIEPDVQTAILKYVKDAGGDPEVGFDRYEDVTVYTGNKTS